jgi:PTH1 family peptidyl-tRNA hydrolase
VQLLVGLGNPGAAYARHRHNIGFMAVDCISAVHGFGPWRSAFHGLVSEGRIGDQKLALLKPMTFMNESGRSVGEAMRFWKLDPATQLSVLYDELDLDPFRMKVKFGGGAAGHNGIRSISAHLTPDFRRVRLGIGHPGHKDAVTPHVLGNFSTAELAPRDDVLDAVARSLPWLLDGDDVRFMSEVARLTLPQR